MHVETDLARSFKSLFGDLLGALLEPYTDGASDAGRVRFAVPDLLVGESSATTLALIIHELATNSIKYGALSMPTGVLEVSCAEQSGQVVLVWKETGGPPIVAPAKRAGFPDSCTAKSTFGMASITPGRHLAAECFTLAQLSQHATPDPRPLSQIGN